MNAEQAKEIIQILISRGINFEDGLTDQEILEIELKFNVTFPPDYRLLLQNALPVSEAFVNWRGQRK